jgi:quercetin dioxygenase-like cupin family protein
MAASTLAFDLAGRLVRYDDLQPCTTAFIDARSPGSDRKENFTIIGPGVAENPDQHVHIDEPHGFNIGGARQPPRCVNSQHYHETAEVFFVHTGRWAFRTGEHADEGEVVLDPGDLISIPTRVFRGFENVGEETGFLYAVLGGDDPGRVVWAPDVLDKAAAHGLVLLESGRLLDTLVGGPIPHEDPPVRPPRREDLERVVRHVDSAALERVVVRAGVAAPVVQALSAPGVTEEALLGPAGPSEPAPSSPLAWSHGFVCRRVSFAPGAEAPEHSRSEPEVLFLHAGQLTVTVEDGRVELNPGDTLTIPRGARRSMRSGKGALTFVTRGGDAPAAPQR